MYMNYNKQKLYEEYIYIYIQCLCIFSAMLGTFKRLVSFYEEFETINNPSEKFSLQKKKKKLSQNSLISIIDHSKIE